MVVESIIIIFWEFSKVRKKFDPGNKVKWDKGPSNLLRLKCLFVSKSYIEEALSAPIVIILLRSVAIFTYIMPALFKLTEFARNSGQLFGFIDYIL